jgi:hypothetical protein
MLLRRTWVDDTVEVETSAERLAALLRDIDGWPTWTRGLKAIQRKRDHALGVGTRFTMVFDPGVPVPCEMVVYESLRLEWGGGALGSVVRHGFTISPIDERRCRLHHLEYATGALAALAFPIEKTLRAYDARWTKTIVARFVAA